MQTPSILMLRPGIRGLETRSFRHKKAIAETAATIPSLLWSTSTFHR